MKQIFVPATVICASLSLLAILTYFQAASNVVASRIAEFALPATSPQGHKIDELSGLAWNATAQTLHAVSDDGYLFDFSLSLESANSPELTVKTSTRLAQNLSKSRDAESLAMSTGEGGSKPPRLLVAYEETGKAIAMNVDGSAQQPVADLPRPSSSDNDGVEAIAELPGGEIAFILEKPVDGTSTKDNVIQFVDAQGSRSQIRFKRTPDENWRIKAFDVLPDGRFLVLQRAKMDESRGYRNQLVVVDNCPRTSDTACSSTALQSVENVLGNSALEGMAVLGNGMIMLANDIKPVDGTSRLLLIQLKGF